MIRLLPHPYIIETLEVMANHMHLDKNLENIHHGQMGTKKHAITLIPLLLAMTVLLYEYRRRSIVQSTLVVGQVKQA